MDVFTYPRWDERKQNAWDTELMCEYRLLVVMYESIMSYK